MPLQPSMHDSYQVKPGARRLHRLLAPHFEDRIFEKPSILVVGTNGKGTVCSLLESVFRHCGFKTGLYTSPHLISPCERIRINNVPISEDALQSHLHYVTVLAEKNLKDASPFELITGAALLVFQNVDVTIFEAGLGGRLDSTNSISPLVCVLTSVGWDHCHLLGSRLTHIAYEKSCIARHHRPFVYPENHPPQVVVKIKNILKQKGALPFPCTPMTQEEETRFLNPHKIQNNWLKLQKTNVNTCLKALQAWQTTVGSVGSDAKIAHGLAKASWPGRFDVKIIKNRTFIFDVGHNSSGFEFFTQLYQQSPYGGQKSVFLCSFFLDKNWQKCLDLITDLAEKIILTEMPSERPVVNAETMGLFLKNHTSKISYEIQKSSQHAVDVIFNNCAVSTPCVVIGSVFFIGHIMDMLNVI